MRATRTIERWGFALGLMLLLVPLAAGAQQGPMVGVVAGYSGSEPRWSPVETVDRVGGLVLGFFVDASTTRGWLSVQAEGTYTQRGGDVIGDGGSGAVEGAVRSDYLSLSVRPTLRAGAGRVNGFVASGPAVDLLVRSRLDAGLATVLRQEGASVFGVVAGAGLDIALGGERTFGVEARVFEGLMNAYSGDFVSMRYRSWQLTGHVAVLLSRFR
ncbi:MAG: hypothetical protein OEN56_12170 [Gemmatimonadota bacterium]|nr:hypothetical protein [Gemmatimonadota bacterium]MDH3423211.1 hypothetical protein [Gemmatimonadota bacterium]